MHKFLRDLFTNPLFFNAIILLFLPKDTFAYMLGALIAIGVYTVMFAGLAVKNVAFDAFRAVADRDTLWRTKQKAYNQGLAVFIILMFGSNWIVSVFHFVASFMLYYRLQQYFGERR